MAHTTIYSDYEKIWGQKLQKHLLKKFLDDRGRSLKLGELQTFDGNRFGMNKQQLQASVTCCA